ncbi:lytic transglycosylase domain-containing protein [bacterium]|nr:lytic transglycosylase domain-containing protein [bacterium]
MRSVKLYFAENFDIHGEVMKRQTHIDTAVLELPQATILSRHQFLRAQLAEVCFRRTVSELFSGITSELSPARLARRCRRALLRGSLRARRQNRSSHRSLHRGQMLFCAALSLPLTVAVFALVVSTIDTRYFSSQKILDSRHSLLANTLASQKDQNSPSSAPEPRLSQKAQSAVAGQVHFLTNHIRGVSGRITPAEAKGLALSIYTEAARAGVDPFLVTSIIHSESTFRANARSNRSAFGLMQVQPTTGRYIAKMVKTEWKGADSLLRDRSYNIQLGVSYLRYLQRRFRGDLRLALMAYNWGPTNLRAALSSNRRAPRSVRNYADKILQRRERLQRSYQSSADQYEFMNVNFVPESLWRSLLTTSSL